MSNRPIVIFGVGGHAVSVADVALSSGFQPIVFVSPSSKGGDLNGVPIVRDIEAFDIGTNPNCAIAVGDNFQRMQIFIQLSKSRPDVKFPVLVHNDASVGNWSSVGHGSVIFAGGRIGPNCTLGDFVIVNTNASLDHDSKIQGFASLAPGVSTGGKVSIGKCTSIGLGTVIKHGVSIGANSVVGSASNVLRDFGNQVVVFGNPAEVKRPRNIDDPYL